MAEELTVRKKDNGKKTGKRSTRVDLTPMVDLGFLLLTFFVFTSALSRAKAMNMNTPNDNKPGVIDKICESCVITLIPAKNNNLWYYEGAEDTAKYKQTDYTATGLRALLLKKKREVAAMPDHRTAVMIIKPAASSSFKNLIDVIDENTIAGYPQYYLDNLSEKDKQFLSGVQ